jgi:hypothetical protein
MKCYFILIFFFIDTAGPDTTVDPLAVTMLMFYSQAGVYHGKYPSPSWYLGRRISFPCWHFFFLGKNEKNFVGLGVKIRVGRVTRNQQLVFFCPMPLSSQQSAQQTV